MSDPIPERVAAGAAFLDEHYGPGWPLVVDPDTLNIGSSCGCVLGQICGSFSAGLVHFGFLEAGGPLKNGFGDVDLGFMWDGAWMSSENEIAALTAEWARVIRERRAAA